MQQCLCKLFFVQNPLPFAHCYHSTSKKQLLNDMKSVKNRQQTAAFYHFYTSHTWTIE